MAKKSNLKTRLRIVLASAITIFSLASCFSVTIAWFQSNRQYSYEASSFSVVGPENVGFDLYYLDHFTVDEENKQGNYNSTIASFSGYENEYEDAVFTKINFEDDVVLNDPDPTDVRHLWPAHKLTYAIVITSKSIDKFSLINWSEKEGEEELDAAKTSAEQYVRLSWAIDIYGAAYSVLRSGNVANDVALGYKNSYYDEAKSDVFEYSEDNLAPISPKETLDIVESVPENLTGYQTIVYFTIEFSNNSDTFYRYNDATGFYVQDNILGNSNCYEGLSISDLEFKLA